MCRADQMAVWMQIKCNQSYDVCMTSKQVPFAQCRKIRGWMQESCGDNAKL